MYFARWRTLIYTRNNNRNRWCSTSLSLRLQKWCSCFHLPAMENSWLSDSITGFVRPNTINTSLYSNTSIACHYNLLCTRERREKTRMKEAASQEKQDASLESPGWGGVLRKVLRVKPFPFIYHFFIKGTSLVYLSLEKGTPFIYLLKESYE